MANRKSKPESQLWGKLQPEISRMRKEPTNGEALIWEELRDWRSKARPINKGPSSPFSPARGENGEGGWR